MTTFPKHPAVKGPAAIADHGRQVTRAHARLDQAESTQSKHTSQITTANTNIATNTTNITTAQNGVNTNTTDIASVNSRLGGTGQETYLGTLGEMSHISNGSESATGGWSTGGALNGGASQYWDNTHAAALVPWMNQVYSDIQNLYNLFGDLLTELQNSNYMH